MTRERYNRFYGNELGGTAFVWVPVWGVVRVLKQRHQIFVALLSVVDGLVMAAACAGALAVRSAASNRAETLVPPELPPELPSQLASVSDSAATSGLAGTSTAVVDLVQHSMVFPAVAIGLASMYAAKLYRPRRDQSLLGEQVRIIRASVVTVVALFVLLWFMGSDIIAADPSDQPGMISAARIQFGTLVGLMPVLLGGWRLSFRIGLQQLRRRGFNLRHVAIIGTGRLAQIACRTLGRNSWTGLQISYFVSHHDDTSRRRCLNHPVMGGLDDLEAILEDRPVDVVYVAMPNSKAVQLRDVLHRLERFAVDVRIIPDVTPRNVPMAMTISEIEGMPVLSYRESPLGGVHGLIKRGLDVLGAITGLMIFGPVMAVIALMVRMESPGPAIFRQRRVSLGGEEFWIYKFRTMRSLEQESDAAWTARSDPRVTRLGRWLRRTSLDELPQLFNVLRGEMSLVGPRPERPELISQFRDDWRGYMLRQHVKAGMTGWAQVNGLRGDTSLRKRLQYDLFYIRHWSLQFDIRILLMTMFRGFINPNAH